MRQSYGMFLRRLILLVLVSCSAILVSILFVILLGHNRISQITLIAEDSYQQMFYNIYHNRGKRHVPDINDFVIFNVHNDSLTFSEERQYIAELLTDIAKQNPKLVVLDLTMVRSDYDSDSEIKKALALYDENSIVVAAENNVGGISQSFFNLDGRYHYGVADIPDFYSYTSEEKCGNKYEPRLVSKAASIISGIPISSLNDNNLVVDYRDIGIVKIKDMDDLSANLIHSLSGKVVIIGDCDSSEDLVQCPFYIGTRRLISGTELNAIIIHSIYSTKNHFQKVPEPINILTCLLFTFVYCCLYYFLDKFSNGLGKYQSFINKLAFFIKPVFLLLGEVVLLYSSVLIFTGIFGLVISPFLAMISIVLVEAFYKCFSCNRNR